MQVLAPFSLRRKDWEIGTRTCFWRDLGGGTSQKCENTQVASTLRLVSYTGVLEITCTNQIIARGQ